MYASELSPGIEIGESVVAFRDIHRAFAATEEGRRLASQIRFAPYKPASLPDAEWERLLGADANTLKHLWESWKAVRKFIALQLQAGVEMSIRDMEGLQMAALIHDWQEGLEGVGDMLDTRKTQDSHTREMELLREMLPRIIDLPGLRARLEEAIDDVLLDRESRLGRIFRAVEIMGYMDTALKAWKKASAVKGTHQEHFRYMAVHVFAHQAPKLLALAPHYPPVAFFLRKHEETLSEMAGLHRDEFRYFPPEGISRKDSHFDGLAEQYLDAKAAWEARSLPEVTLTEEN
jgi:hypothetical protein